MTPLAYTALEHLRRGGGTYATPGRDHELTERYAGNARGMVVVLTDGSVLHYAQRWQTVEGPYGVERDRKGHYKVVAYYCWERACVDLRPGPRAETAVPAEEVPTPEKVELFHE